jgi:uncharacterized protein with HEPN domain
VTTDPNPTPRLAFLTRVVRKECRHLRTTDQRLFPEPFTPARAAQLETDSELAERVEAFVGRFGRLQDTVGDKLLPALLAALGEPTGAAIDNLDRAERFGWLESSDTWMTMRKLRNQMIHEYVEDLAVLSDALDTAHGYVPTLISVATCLTDEAQRRGWS